MHRRTRMASLGLVGLIAAVIPVTGALAQPGAPDKKKPDFPKFDDVAKDYDKVVSTLDGSGSLYTLYKREKDGQMLAELPRGYARQKHFLAMTLAAGDMWAGLQGSDQYFYWKRFDKRIAMIAPNLATRSTGDQESRVSVSRHFTDKVILDVPIVCMGPSGQPVIDLDALLVGQASKFFGRDATGLNTRLATVAKAKAFPKNVEVAFTVPARDGAMKTFHYSLSQIPDNTGYKPRAADHRVGFFTTSYRDLGKFRDDEKWVRYVNRWKVEKSDPKLKLSPAKEPIVFYVEHTVPVRYRRFVRDGVLYWNKAFEAIGIIDAVEVRYQDKASGANMEKDPEDVRYNFIRWLSNDVGTAIGPSRVHPKTGQILDADVVLTDGWIRHFWFQFNEQIPEIAMEGFDAETLAWLARHPQWDPRIRLAEPAQRDYMLAQRAKRGVLAYGGHPIAAGDPTIYGDDEFDGLAGRVSQMNGMCLAARGKGMDMALMRMHMELASLIVDGDEGDNGEPATEEDEESDKPVEPESDLIDGVPDWFVGPMLADLVAHEVGHCIGLRHNFKASSYYTLAEINSEDVKGTPFTMSVMDYSPININMESGEVQGDYAMVDIGPYDMWAIEYGYGFGDPKKVLEKVGDPRYAYGTDEDTSGPDPFARRYDFTKDPLDYAENQMRLANYHRENLLEKFVKDGQSWAKARRGYDLTLRTQTGSLSMMANWLGGAFVHRVNKGDEDTGAPIEVVDAERQRRALDFIIHNAFHDEAFGLTPDLLEYMTIEKWWDTNTARADATWPVHDRIMGIQASALTMILNPTTIKRVYDNEFRVASDEDMVTVPEVMGKVRDSIWTELTERPSRTYTERKPMVSSLRRNLQREHMERLMDLAMPGAMSGAAAKPVSNIARLQLRDLHDEIGTAVKSAGRLDTYTRAHLQEAHDRIAKVLDADYIYNASDMGGGGAPFSFSFGQDGQ